MRKILFLIAAFAVLVIVAVAGPPGYKLCQVDQQVELIGIADVPFMQPADIACSSPEVGNGEIVYCYTAQSIWPGFDVTVTGSAGGVAYICSNARDNYKNTYCSSTDFVYIGNQINDNRSQMNKPASYILSCNLKFPLLL